LRLPPGLHALGFMSAIFVATRAVVDAVRRSRRRSSPALVLQSTDEAPSPPRKPSPLRTVKPRTHFGLRGVQR
jgi:hypothetical protein